MSLASTFTLSRLSADLTYDLGKATEVPENVTVQCAISRGKLMVLVESPNVDQIPVNYVFAQVETLIRHRLEIDGLPVEANHLGTAGEPVPIKVYLKHPTMQKPTAVHRFNWLLQDSSGPILLDDVDLGEFEPLLNQQPEVAPERLFDDDGVTGDLSEEEFLSNEEFLFSEELPPSGEFQIDEPTSVDDELLNLEGLYKQPSNDGPEDDVSALNDDELPEAGSEKQRISSGLIAAGIGVAAVFGTLGYGLSRPCVLGGCDRIPQAQALGDAALIALKEEPTPQTVIEMSEQLNTAVNTLKPIPPWSQYRGRSQELLANYQGEANLLNAVAAAQENAYQAAKDSQNPPHPIAHWEGIANRWRETIAQLEEIPPGSPIYNAFIAPKLQEYRGNLATIEGRVVSEQNAEKHVNQAQLTASLAKNQAEIANTLPAWKTALDSWTQSVEQLKQIPRGTVPHGESRKLLTKYEADLAKVRTRYQQEQAADQFYNEAVRYAATARQYEAEEQWTLAMLGWRDAITQVKGVPLGTSRYADGQTLLKNYEPALSKAQENLRLALRFDKAKENFSRVCKPTFCQFGMRGGVVQLSLAEKYDALADFSITDPTNRTSVPASDQMIRDVNLLLQEVINIGKRTQLPIELYGSDDGFIARFSPELEGYVKTLVIR